MGTEERGFIKGLFAGIIITLLATAFVMACTEPPVPTKVLPSPPLPLEIYQAITPYGYVRSDLYDVIEDANAELLRIQHDQDRIINILRNELVKNKIPVPEIPYPTTWNKVEVK